MITHSGARIEPSSKFGGKYKGVPTLTDIALGLGRAPRFAGQTRTWWSGLLHSFVCYEIARACFRKGDEDKRVMLLCLLHDAHEAVTGDVPAFFKTREMSDYQAEIDERLFTALGLWPITAIEHVFIKKVDDAALRAEAAVLGPPAIMSHIGDPEESHKRIVLQIHNEFPNPSDTDGIDCKAARWFYALYAHCIGEAVWSRANDTPNTQPAKEILCLTA